MENLLISIICVAIVLFAFYKKHSKYKGKLSLKYTMIVLFLIGAILYIRLHFIPFATPEEAYRYAYGGDVETIVEGAKSAYVIGDKGEKYLNKSENGWMVPAIKISITKGIKKIGSTTIYASQYNFSEEYYIMVVDLENKCLKINDNRDSFFYKLSTDETDSKVEACIYCACVSGINGDYKIVVNEEVFQLLE